MVKTKIATQDNNNNEDGDQDVEMNVNDDEKKQKKSRLKSLSSKQNPEIHADTRQTQSKQMAPIIPGSTQCLVHLYIN